METKEEMIAAIAARHGVRLDRDDPAFLIVELNRMMLEEQVAELRRLVGRIESEAAIRDDADARSLQKLLDRGLAQGRAWDSRLAELSDLIATLGEGRAVGEPAAMRQIPVLMERLDLRSKTTRWLALVARCVNDSPICNTSGFADEGAAYISHIPVVCISGFQYLGIVIARIHLRGIDDLYIHSQSVWMICTGVHSTGAAVDIYLSDFRVILQDLHNRVNEFLAHWKIRASATRSIVVESNLHPRIVVSVFPVRK